MYIAIEATHANKPHRTGVEEVCFQTIEQLKQTIPASERVVLYCNKPLQGSLAVIPSNWSVKVLRWPLSKGWSQIRLSLEFLTNKYDIFFAPGQLVPFFCPKNTVSIVHDSAFRVFTDAYGLMSRIYLHWMNKIIAKKSKKIIMPSQFSKDEFLNYYKYDEKNIIVIPWGVRSCQQLEVQKNSTIPYILSIGRLERKKNTKRIIQAFNIVKQTQKSLQLILVGGPGVGYDEIEKEINNSPYKKDIIIKSWVEQNKLNSLLQNSRVFVFPSLYEGFGLPVAEAMACGCPVVCSSGNSLEEVGGDVVMYVNSKDVQQLATAVNSIINNRELAQDLIKKGYERAKLFSWKTAGKQIWNTLSL